MKLMGPFLIIQVNKPIKKIKSRPSLPIATFFAIGTLFASANFAYAAHELLPLNYDPHYLYEYF